MTNIRRSGSRYNPGNAVLFGFDKVKVRFAAVDRPSPELLALLTQHCHRIGRVRRAHHIAGTDLGYSLRIVAPDDDALRAIRSQHWLVNEVELARNTITIDRLSAEKLNDEYDETFAQPWHGKHVTRWYYDKKTGTRTTYSGQRRNGLRFAWYSYAPCKFSHAPNCFHIEARVVGVQAVRRIGIYSVNDLLRFPHDDFWQYWEGNRRRIDVERLGRFHLNQLEGKRRKRPRIEKHGRLTRNVDMRVGGLLKRILCQHPQQELRSVQWLIDRYGRGPYLLPVPTRYELEH